MFSSFVPLFLVCKLCVLLRICCRCCLNFNIIFSHAFFDYNYVFSSSFAFILFPSSSDTLCASAASPAPAAPASPPAPTCPPQTPSGWRGTPPPWERSTRPPQTTSATPRTTLPSQVSRLFSHKINIWYTERGGGHFKLQRKKNLGRKERLSPLSGFKITYIRIFP